MAAMVPLVQLLEMHCLHLIWDHLVLSLSFPSDVWQVWPQEIASPRERRRIWILMSFGCQGKHPCSDNPVWVAAKEWTLGCMKCALHIIKEGRHLHYTEILKYILYGYFQKPKGQPTLDVSVILCPVAAKGDQGPVVKNVTKYFRSEECYEIGECYVSGEYSFSHTNGCIKCYV